MAVGRLRLLEPSDRGLTLQPPRRMEMVSPRTGFPCWVKSTLFPTISVRPLRIAEEPQPARVVETSGLTTAIAAAVKEDDGVALLKKTIHESDIPSRLAKMFSEAFGMPHLTADMIIRRHRRRGGY